MRAITLWQPWASAVALGLKRVETRSWPTKYRGPLAIHAAKRWAPEQRDKYETKQQSFEDAGWNLDVPLPLGSLVCICELYTIIETDDWIGSSRERSWGDFSEGRYAWQLMGARRILQPVPILRGSQTFFTVPDIVSGLESRRR
jgi:hypothetical protein